MVSLRHALKIAERRLAEIMPPSVYFAIQDAVRPLLDQRTVHNGRIVRKVDSVFQVKWRDGTAFTFPHQLRYCRYMRRDGLDHILNELLAKYQDGAVKIELGDVLFEVGANVGEFTRAAIEKGARVFAAEPDPLAATCLRRNVPGATISDYAIGDHDGIATFNLSTAGADSSVINPSGRPVKVPMRTIASWMREAKVERIDFLKVEAEGFEPEVLEGAKAVLDRIRKIAIDCGPERKGKPTFDECEAVLKGRFELWRRDWMLFGLSTDNLDACSEETRSPPAAQ